MIIDCDSCQVRPAACGDCVVSYVLGPMPWAVGEGMVDEERAALAVLADSGLLPPLRLVPSSEARAHRDVPGDGLGDVLGDGHSGSHPGRAVS